jgi:hypothetical protein
MDDSFVGGEAILGGRLRQDTLSYLALRPVQERPSDSDHGVDDQFGQAAEHEPELLARLVVLEHVPELQHAVWARGRLTSRLKLLKGRSRGSSVRLDSSPIAPARPDRYARRNNAERTGCGAEASHRAPASIAWMAVPRHSPAVRWTPRCREKLNGHRPRLCRQTLRSSRASLAE